jgi:demethylmenaquinone methyltransferase / 2-methoxy-6-polyprenyl-1,4-benzoquinol methylase
MMQLDKSSARVRQMFGEIAGRYDLLNHVLSLGIDLAWRRKTVRLVPPEPGGGPILDVCTGTGDLALAYWRSSSRGHRHSDKDCDCCRCRSRIVATDFCHPMLVLANQKCRRAGAERQISWLEADTQQLPFEDDQFQIVCVAFGLRNVSDTDRGLREMARVCRPGGRVAVLEFSMPKLWLLGPLYSWYFHRVLPRIGQALARNRQSAYNYLPASVSQFPQGEELAERMRAAGLSKVEYHGFTLGIATLYVGRK